MTRLIGLTFEITLLIGWAIGAVIAWLADDLQWSVICLLGLLQSCTQLQVLGHGARLDRLDDVIGAWRRQDPNAWRP